MSDFMPIIIICTGFFAMFIAILWLMLPFAVFGIKEILRDILYELREGGEP